MLQEEISRAIKQPNFVTIVCQAFEGGSRQKLLQSQQGKLPDDFLSNVIKLLKLPGLYVLAIGCALTQSQYRNLGADGMKLLRSKLNEVTSSNNNFTLAIITSMHEEVIRGLILLVSTSEELSELSGAFLQVMESTLLPLQQEKYRDIVFSPVFKSQFQRQQLNQQQQLSTQQLQRNFNSNGSIATLLSEVGSKCSSTAALFRTTLKNFNIPLDEKQLAEILITVLVRSDDPKKEPWNLDAVAEVLHEEARNSVTPPINWDLVTRFLDQPSFIIRSDVEFSTLSRLFVRVSGSAMPASGLLAKIWSNRKAQLIMLAMAAGSPIELVDFSALVSPENLITGSDIPVPPNLSWTCLPFYSILLELAESGLAAEVLEVIMAAANHYPEYIFISMAQMKADNRGGGAASLWSEVLTRLLPLFTGLPRSRPTSVAVMMKLQQINPPLLVLLFRVAFRRCRSFPEIADTDMKLKNMTNVAMMRSLEEEGTVEDLLGYLCFKADKQPGFNLEDAVSHALEKAPQDARIVFAFLNSNSNNLPSRISNDMGLLSMESFQLLLHLLQKYTMIVPIDELRALLQRASMSHPQLAQQLSQSSDPHHQLVQEQQFRLQQLAIQEQQQMKQQQQQHLLEHQRLQQQQLQQNQLASLEQQQNKQLLQNPFLGGMYANADNANPLANVSMNPGGDNGMESLPLPEGGGPKSKEVEEETNAYFHKIYTSNVSIGEVVQLLKKFKSSEVQREQEIFRCMIHNLFDEYRFFHRYPEKELLITANLFGNLVQHQLVSSITLGIALRYILEALRKDPDLGGNNEKIFRFGKVAVECFLSRLGEWPQYSSHLIQIPHLMRHCPEVFSEAQRVLANPSAGTGSGRPPSEQMLQQNGASMAGNSFLASNIDVTSSSASSLRMMMQNQSLSDSQPGGGLQLGNDVKGDSASAAASLALSPPTSLSAFAEHVANSNFMSLSASSSASSVKYTPITPLAPIISSPLLGSQQQAGKDASEVEVTVVPSKFALAIEKLSTINVDFDDVPLPPENLRDQVQFAVNNIAKANCEAKSLELRDLLKDEEHHKWFASYLVVKRISTQPNLHSLYLTMLDVINSPNLTKTILESVYQNVTKLLHSANITASSSERSLLRNLGMWLGQMTLARNKPILSKRLNLKCLLFWGYETGRLIAVCSFVAKIVEGSKDSRIFRPSNPWISALLGVFRELYDIEDLKMNIKFEVQVLCKNLNIKIEDIPKGNALSQCKTPIKDQRNPDFNIKPGQQQSAASASLGEGAHSDAIGRRVFSISDNSGVNKASLLPDQASAASTLRRDISATSSTPLTAGGVAAMEQTVIPNLGAYVTIPALPFFANNPQCRRLVPLAVDRAIREIIHLVVEHTVAFASTTTKHILYKDFATEPNEATLRQGAHLMISTLAGSLALITCKEPLRQSIVNQLFMLLSQAAPGIDSAVLEEILQTCSSDNLALGCMLIEKASTEKSLRDVEEHLLPAMQTRRKLREAGQPFSDSSHDGAKYPKELPDALKPTPGGLSIAQLSLYEGFARARAPPPTQTASATAGVSATATASAAVTSANAAGGALLGTPSPNSLQGWAAEGNKTLKQPLNSASIAGGQNLDMSQALQAYQITLSRIDMVLKAIEIQSQGREVSISMLGQDHEIIGLLRDMVAITMKIQPSIRNETSLTFCENVFKRLVETTSMADSLRLEVTVGILEALREAGGSSKFLPDIVNWLSQYAVFNPNDESSRKVHLTTLVLLLRARLLRSQDADVYFATFMDGGRNMIWVELALTFVRQCLAEGLSATYEFANTFETVSKMRPTNAAVRKQLQKWLTDLRALASAKDEQKAASIADRAAGGTPAAPNAAVQPQTPAPPVVADHTFREHVTLLLERWLRVWSTANDVIFGQYLQLLHQYGVLKTEDAADRFFRIATDLCIEACLKSAVPSAQPPQSGSFGEQPYVTTTLTYSVIDALTKLFLLLVRLADKEAGDVTVRVNLLTRILNAVARTLLEDHETKKNQGKAFDQRPHFRLISNLSMDLGFAPDSKLPQQMQEPNPSIAPLLIAHCQIYLVLQPSVLPGFAFAWVQLISHRSFMPQLLLIKNQRGWPYMHRLLSTLLNFLNPFLKQGGQQRSDAISSLYKGTIRIFLVLLHDFPEFLSDYYFSLCDAIPQKCVQLRNLILSAFPRSIRLPDPFTYVLRMDSFSDATAELVTPRILSDYASLLTERDMVPHLDSYLTTRQPLTVPSFIATAISNNINSLSAASANGVSNSEISTTLIGALVIYVGVQAVTGLQMTKQPLQTSPAMDIFRQLVITLDSDGRHHLIHAIANQLRYPNVHTFFFSCVLLTLFSEANSEFFQEQITRVLLERLIVYKPHPWGLLATFCELIKNPRYGFWAKSYTRMSPDITRIFESTARSCGVVTAAQG